MSIFKIGHSRMRPGYRDIRVPLNREGSNVGKRLLYRDEANPVTYATPLFDI